MKSWRLRLAILLIVASSLLLPAVHWRLIGWARGEAFYQGRPTSYWKRQVRQAVMKDFFLSGDLYFAEADPEPGVIESWLNERLGQPEDLVERPVPWLGDPAMLPVLQEMLSCAEMKVQLFAIQGLGALGAAAEPAWPTLVELRRTTTEYLVYREASDALRCIDSKAAKELADHPDADGLLARYQVRFRFADNSNRAESNHETLATAAGHLADRRVPAAAPGGALAADRLARGEDFYHGRPTSYWKRLVRQAVMIDSFLSGDLYFFEPKPGDVEKWLNEHLGLPKKQVEYFGPLWNDPAVLPLLQEMLSSEEMKLQLFAIQTLGCLRRHGGARLADPGGIAAND